MRRAALALAVRRASLALALLLAACGGESAAPDAGRVVDGGVMVDSGVAPDAFRNDGGPPIEGDAPGNAVSWTASDARIANPERGFYRYVDIASDRDLSFVREGGDTLVYSYVHLDPYRSSAIAASLLDDVQAGLDAARAAGIEVVLRFAYNEGPYPVPEPDAPLARVLEHITQLQPLLRANEDVIAVVQAGFIGAWGEWHSSTNDLDVDPAARRAILEALLDAMPSSRSTQIRNPVYKEAMYGAAIDEAIAYDGSYEARTGHHNDCFLASESDFGTYPSDDIERWITYVADDTRFAPMGGETCAVFPARSSCSFAPSEMERLHFSFVNRDYNTDVVASWVSGGCMDAIERRLGYRLALIDGELPPAVRPGGSFRARVRLRNEGWAAPFNPRTAWLVLEGAGDRFEVELPASDVRRWAAGEEITIDVHLRIPAATSAGEHRIALWLPSAADDLRARPEYSIQLANAGVWDAARGWNVLATVEIDPTAEGASDPSATDFEVIP